jgi:4a-hydroxytetrahydrobiopterin dehydratase
MALVKTHWSFAKLYTAGASRQPVPKRLSPAEIDKRLKNLPGWRREGRFVTKTFEFKEFMEGIAFVEKVAKVAEKEEHHPDVHIRYTTVTLSLQTHSEGGVTEWDLELAEAIEKMVSGARRS